MPQDLVRPFRRLAATTTVSFPQSQRQRQQTLLSPDFVLWVGT